MVLVAWQQGRRRTEVRLDRLGEVMKCHRCGRKDFTAEHCESPAMWHGPGAETMNRREGR